MSTTESIANKFKYLPASDSMVDDSYELIADPRFSIQDASGYSAGYGVVVEHKAGEFTFYDTEHPTLKEAMKECLSLYENELKNKTDLKSSGPGI